MFGRTTGTANVEWCISPISHDYFPHVFNEDHRILIENFGLKVCYYHDWVRKEAHAFAFGYMQIADDEPELFEGLTRQCMRSKLLNAPPRQSWDGAGVRLRYACKDCTESRTPRIVEMNGIHNIFPLKPSLRPNFRQDEREYYILPERCSIPLSQMRDLMAVSSASRVGA